jgi:AcrR family transcriptional regulator
MPRIRAENVNAHKALNRASILDAAEKIFSSDGFIDSSLTDVADAAGVGRSTIYEYFESKDDLLLGVAESRLRPLMNEVDSFSAPSDAMDAICKLCRLTIDFLADNLQLTRIVTWESHYLSIEYQDRMWSLVEPLVEQLRRLIEIGLPDENAEVLSRVISFALRDAGDILLHADKAGFEPEEVKRTTIGFIRRGLGLPDEY